MTELYECLTCRGQYYPIQADGSLYFHACPPLPGKTPVEFIPRPDARDENLVVDAAGQVRGIKAAGKGRVPVKDLPPPPPSPAPLGLLARVRSAIFG